MNKISGCIILYKNNREVLLRTISSFLKNQPDIKLFLIDNSPTDELKNIYLDSRVEYLHNPSNPGFGAAHNIAIKKVINNGFNYHFVVNPDVYFNEDVITPMVSYMEKNPKLGMLMPQILNDDGTIQNLPKLLPSPFSVLMRKLKKPKKMYDKFINEYELRFVNKDLIYDAPVLSGCFTLLNLRAIKEVGMYDDSFFMYFEDWDLSRRMHQKYQTTYFPLVSVFHSYESGANKSLRLFKIFVKSARIYFNKWGWFFDADRKKINKRALDQFK